MNCFLRRKECNILLVFKSQFTSLLHHNNFKMTKSIRLNATRYSIKKIANKSELEELQETASNHSSDDDLNILKNHIHL